MQAKLEQKAEAIRLRVDERKTLPEIQALIPVSKGSLSTWLRDHPLTEDERRARRSQVAIAENKRRSLELGGVRLESRRSARFLLG